MCIWIGQIDKFNKQINKFNFRLGRVRCGHQVSLSDYLILLMIIFLQKGKISKELKSNKAKKKHQRNKETFKKEERKKKC